MKRWGRLLLWVCAVAAVWGGLQFHQASGNDDLNMLTLIGSTYAIGVLVMIQATKRWTIRGLGLLGTMLADALLYLSSVAVARFGWVWFASEGRLDLIRALFLVGGLMLLYGLIDWMIQTWRGRNGVEVPHE